MELIVKHELPKRAAAPKVPSRSSEWTLIETKSATPPANVLGLISRPETRVSAFGADAEDVAGADRSQWVAIVAQGDDRCVAAASVAPAEASVFARRNRVPEEVLRHCLTLSRVHVDPAFSDLLPAILYLALRRGRVLERLHVVSYADDPQAAPCRLLDLQPLHRLQAIREGDAQRLPVCQRLDIAIHRAERASEGRGRALLREHFIDEAVETLEVLIERLFATPWFESVHAGTLTKEQYIYSLSNMHQFVRWTTRLIGRAVSLSHDPELRTHFLDHLSGEINHELLIEKDLATLGADVEYVKTAMVPNLHTQEFMVVQESMIAFHEDPILFMAAPFAAEGFSSRLDTRFMRSLEACVRSWGIANPKQATSFIASHIHFDGGDDGHWEHTRTMLARRLETELQLEKFLNALRLAMNGFIRSYASYVETLGIWSATS